MKQRSIPNSAVHTGSLILVNAGHRCPVPPRRDLVLVGEPSANVAMDRRAALLLAQLMEKIKGWQGIVPVSGWRSQGEQQAIWDGSLIKSGEEFTRKFVAVPGHSEHQTGLAIDLGERREQVDFLCPDFPEDGVCGEFRRLAARYGFILRYPAGKEPVTGIACEPWHFRYVGAPHALIMEERGLALEEYHQLLRRHPWGGEPLQYQGNGLAVEVSYLPAAPGGETAWETDGDLPCTVSGDNVGGFVVTRWVG